MRRLYVAGNWKMNMDKASAHELAAGLKQQFMGCCCKPGCHESGIGKAELDVAVCPSFVYLPEVIETLKGTCIQVGAQNAWHEPKGAFTGEVSVGMLKDIGCSFTILGHSERRHVMGETDELINKKVKAALDGGLEVILCIGELLEEREAGKTEAVCERHLREGLSGVTAEQMASVTVAYEPVWAIGTGKTATPDQAQEVHAFCRGILNSLFGDAVADATRIQYGGSVKPGNAAELMGQPDVDGALVGGASLKVDDFMGIIKGALG